MSKRAFDLHEERLGTTDQDGHRIYLFLDEVKGIWEKRRHLVYYLLLMLYLAIPWTTINGKQTILLNIAEREFFIFGHSFFAHNIPLVFIVIFVFILSFAIITSLWGRVWCGWACPQTVFIEVIYRKIENFIEGNSRQRRRGYQNKNVVFYLRRTLKWILFTAVSIGISHSFLAYFVESKQLLHIVFNKPSENWSLFTTSLFVSAIVLFDFGWFREQFCIIMCPYGRIQSIFMDERSLVVGYDYNRGEPRKTPKDKEANGDCVNCYKCVQVCPTGIDIRRGTQLECIHCTRCIDACDEIMVKVKKPKGLIRYTNEFELTEKKQKSTNLRVLVYFLILMSSIIIGAYFISKATNLDIQFLRGTRTPYTETIKDAQRYIISHYQMSLFYNEGRDLVLKIRNKDPESTVEVVVPKSKIVLKPSRKSIVYLFFRTPFKDFINGNKKVSVDVFDGETLLTSKSLNLIGPIK